MTLALERIGSGISPVKNLGAAPCPGECGRQGAKVELWGMVHVLLCDPCQTEADDRIEAEERAEQLRVALMAAGARDNDVLYAWSLSTYPTDRPEYRQALKFAKTWVERYMAGERENVMIYGPSGGGKSGLAWAVVRDLTERGVSARFASWAEALETMKDAFRHQEQTKASIALRRAPVLVLDDVGAERPTDYARGELLRLVDHRMMNHRPTWVTSNFDPGALAARLGHDDPIIGKRIVSRMAGGARQFVLDVPDRRMAA